MLNDYSSTQNSISRLQPVLPGERIDALDVLRGVAILGVLVAYAVWNLGTPPLETYGVRDQLLSFVLNLLVNNKAFTLLSFLFGVGFSIQMCRAAARGFDVAPTYVRRLSALLLIGLLHAVLLRNGDILVPYAVMGLLLLLFRNASGQVLIAAAAISVLLPHVGRYVWELSGFPYPTRPETEGMTHLAANFLWLKYMYSTAITIWPTVVPMFLAGLYAGRRGVSKNILTNKKSIRRIMWIGLVAGLGIFFGRLVLLGLMGPDSNPTAPINMVLIATWYMHAWGLAAFYGCALILLLQRGRWQTLLSPFKAVGRMALTNYLLQSMMIVPICIALDLFDRVTPTVGLILALAVGIVQVPASMWWLKRFRFGPAEWLWRSLTYNRPQPMRLTPVRYPISNDIRSESVSPT